MADIVLLDGNLENKHSDTSHSEEICIFSKKVNGTAKLSSMLLKQAKMQPPETIAKLHRIPKLRASINRHISLIRLFITVSKIYRHTQCRKAQQPHTPLHH